jgi:hypothetical protein
MSGLGVLLLGLSSYYGGALVYTHHVGVDLSREQELLDHTDDELRPPHHVATQH